MGCPGLKSAVMGGRALFPAISMTQTHGHKFHPARQFAQTSASSSRHQNRLGCLYALIRLPSLGCCALNLSTVDHRASPWSVFLIFLRLGLTSFGGPVAHLGYFRDEFVTRRRWLSERTYADLVAMCQFLPGPASSQVGIALGLSRAGYGGALAAWLGFTLPSAVVLILFAMGIAQHSAAIPSGVLHGLKVVAVAVVAQAVWGMARNLCTDATRITVMLIAACIALLQTSAWGQVGVIAAAALAGLLWLNTRRRPPDALPITLSRRTGAMWLALFLILLAGLPLLAQFTTRQDVAMIDAFYRTGALVFGGGHVVLPLLQAEVVPTLWVSNDVFLAGYGAAQAMPGPLFTFAAFLGASMQQPPPVGLAVCSACWRSLRPRFCW